MVSLWQIGKLELVDYSYVARLHSLHKGTFTTQGYMSTLTPHYIMPGIIMWSVCIVIWITVVC